MTTLEERSKEPVCEECTMYMDCWSEAGGVVSQDGACWKYVPARFCLRESEDEGMW